MSWSIISSIFSVILSDIYADILFDIYSNVQSDLYLNYFAPSIGHVLGPVHAHPDQEPAIHRFRRFRASPRTAVELAIGLGPVCAHTAVEIDASHWQIGAGHPVKD